MWPADAGRPTGGVVGYPPAPSRPEPDGAVPATLFYGRYLGPRMNLEGPGAIILALVVFVLVAFLFLVTWAGANGYL